MLKKQLITGVTIILLLLPFASGCSQKSISGEVIVDQFTDDLNAQVPNMLEAYGVPGVSIGLIREGELVWTGAYGYADLDQNIEMDLGTVFRAESISKSVTAWGVMTLVEEGLIELDQPVMNYIQDWEFPESDFDLEAITVRALLSGSSGLALGSIGPVAEYVPGDPGMPSLRDYLSAEVAFEQTPGEGFIYSNVGFNLLQLLIEEVTGQSFETYMNDVVLKPLGMQHASYTWHESNTMTMATGYDLQGQPVQAYIYPASASGGLTSTVEGIARFVSAGMTGPYFADHGLLSEDSIHMIYTPQVNISSVFGVVAESYGFGHFLETLPNNQRAVWHGGQGHGWMTHFHAIPETGNGIVILTNSQRSWPLIAAILRDWSDWLDYGLVDFSRIVLAQYAMWALIVGLFAVALWQVNKLRKGIAIGKFHLKKGIKGFGFSQVFRILVSLAVLGGLLWSINQPYLMVSAVFPSSVGWLGIGLLLFAITNLLSAWLPIQSRRNK